MTGVGELGDTRVVRRPDRVLLEGPHSRRRGLGLVLRTIRDFIAGFRTLHFVGPCVTVFGSARYDESHPYYALGRELGRGLAHLGFTVMTGGGPGSWKRRIAARVRPAGVPSDATSNCRRSSRRTGISTAR